jgi:UDP-galactopyranose mutase
VADATREIVILGAGPCGLACARELQRLGHRRWRVLERTHRPGGLAASVVDAAGFTWDLGGHVVFSHFGEFDALLAEVMGEDVHRHERSSYVRFRGRWVPYPFQNNLRHLPPEVCRECLDGLRTAPGGHTGMDFGEWMCAVFGTGITRHFMRPYNLKVWATEPEWMSSRWIGERVAVVDYERAARNVQEGRDDLAWGPNNRFVFPARGATGEIYRRVATRLERPVEYGRCAVALDPERRRLRLADGEEVAYDRLLSTIPLDRLVAMTAAPEPLRDAAAGLRHNSVYMVGVGLEQPLRDSMSWMYFPEATVPFYRVTNFAKYAAANVPGGDVSRLSAFMTETAFSAEVPQPREGLEDRVVAGLREAGLARPGSPVASAHVETIDYAYPVPTLERDAALALIQPWLRSQGILSRGRFGAWRYELGNMDHAVKMGIDAARAMVGAGEEELWSL